MDTGRYMFCIEAICSIFLKAKRSLSLDRESLAGLDVLRGVHWEGYSLVWDNRWIGNVLRNSFPDRTAQK